MRYGITDRMVLDVEAGAEEHFRSAAAEHGIGHARSVRDTALGLLPPGGDRNMCSVIALLHDADDYKQFPDSAGGVPNALRIMADAGIPGHAIDTIEHELLRFGYSKRLKGLRPETPEGMAASDADMLDIAGASGIIRLAYYDAAAGWPFFDPDDLPNPDLNYSSYMACPHESAVRHMFDKILRLPGCMLTERGQAEAAMRQDIAVKFLYALFREKGRPDWTARLDALLAGLLHQDQ